MTRLSDMAHKATLPASAGRVPVIVDGDPTNYVYDLASDLTARPKTTDLAVYAKSADLSDSTNAAKGAALSAFNTSLSYTAGSVGAFLKSLLASTGSSLLGFISAATGAVGRTTQDKLRDTIHVKDFGATGDGTTWDGGAYNLAIATGNTVRATNGAYNIFATGQKLYDARFRTVQAGDPALGTHGEIIQITNPTSNHGYEVRQAILKNTGNVTGGGTDLGDTFLGFWSNVTNGFIAGRWTVVSSPLNPASGITGAPTGAQSFGGSIAEDNPQNRYADPAWSGEMRRFVNWIGGRHVIPETQDFTNLLGVRVGYKIAYGFAVAKSPYTNSDQQRHAQLLNGFLVNPNAIAGACPAFFCAGYRPFPVAITISAAGSGYVVGDLLTFNSGTDQSANENTVVRVKTVNGTGGITGAEIYNSGWFTATFANPIGVTGGTGTGAIFGYTLSTGSAETPRAVIGVSANWNYVIDCADWTGTNSFVGSAVLTALARAPNNTPVIVAQKADKSADIQLSKLNTSNEWELSQAGTITRLKDNLTIMPAATATPVSNGELTWELTSNTTLKIKVKGSDGTVRSTSLTLA